MSTNKNKIAQILQILGTGNNITTSPSGAYSGTWTVEEEEYAELIVNEFRAGTCPDAKDGITLRRYLAEKLGCLPKRVSKKYESSGYNGRQVYQKRRSPMPPEESQMRLAKLADLETKFEASRQQLRRPSKLQAKRAAGPPKPSPRISSNGATASATDRATLTDMTARMSGVDVRHHRTLPLPQLQAPPAAGAVGGQDLLMQLLANHHQQANYCTIQSSPAADGFLQLLGHGRHRATGTLPNSSLATPALNANTIVAASSLPSGLGLAFPSLAGSRLLLHQSNVANRAGLAVGSPSGLNLVGSSEPSLAQMIHAGRQTTSTGSFSAPDATSQEVNRLLFDAIHSDRGSAALTGQCRRPNPSGEQEEQPNKRPRFY